MNIRQVIKALNAGAYKVEPVSECGCTFDWHIDEDGKLVDGSDGADCYEGFILLVDDNIVADRTRYDANFFVNGLYKSDIPEEIWKQMQPPTTVQRWETGNPAVHEARRRDALITFLMEGQYALARSDERGFANEYTMILQELPDGVVFMSVTREEAEAWADAFLYRGSESTEAFVGFRMESMN